MISAIRMILVVTLMLSLGASLSAQETTTSTAAATATSEVTTTATAAPATETVEAGEPVEAEEISRPVALRERFASVLREHPYELSDILVLDPGLMNNKEFMAGYPEVARFIAEHPEIPRNPRFYLTEFRERQQARQLAPGQAIIEPLLTFFGIALFAYGITWLIRTFIEQKRWTRLSRQQAEVHNKILDRFGTTAELLEYVRSEAGTKFLESAPIPVHADSRPAQNAPMSRIMWTIQFGIVAIAASLGLLFAGLTVDRESALAFYALGAISFCLGAGFIGSAVVSMTLSRRLGLWQEPPAGSLREPGEAR